MAIIVTSGVSRKAGRLVFGSGLSGTTIVLPAVAATLVLPSVTIPALPSGASIDRVTGAISWRKQVESSAAPNAIDGAQQIQVRSDAPGTFINAISIGDNSLDTDVSATEGGSMVLGDSDVSGEVVGADTYEFQWLLAKVDGASLTLHDVQTHLIVEFT